MGDTTTTPKRLTEDEWRAIEADKASRRETDELLTKLSEWVLELGPEATRLVIGWAADRANWAHEDERWREVQDAVTADHINGRTDEKEIISTLAKRYESHFRHLKPALERAYTSTFGD